MCVRREGAGADLGSGLQRTQSAPTGTNSPARLCHPCVRFAPLQERHYNLGTFGGTQLHPTAGTGGPYGLPDAAEWPHAGPPPDGAVPFVASMVSLVNSRIPLLEYRGCHGLARITYSAPYGNPDPKVGCVRPCARPHAFCCVYACSPPA
jgi:hypothetical protein